MLVWRAVLWACHVVPRGPAIHPSGHHTPPHSHLSSLLCAPLQGADAGAQVASPAGVGGGSGEGLLGKVKAMVGTADGGVIVAYAAGCVEKHTELGRCVFVGEEFGGGSGCVEGGCGGNVGAGGCVRDVGESLDQGRGRT